MRSDKANPIYLLHILREYSDKDHILSMHAILEKLRVQLSFHCSQPIKGTHQKVAAVRQQI